MGVATLGTIGLIYVNRAQPVVDDSRFMRAMIPHHSIAINNAHKATIRDPRLRRLADGIIESQLAEIVAMQALLADLEARGQPSQQPLPAVPAVMMPELTAKAAGLVQ